jgi:hypothetical protein
MFQTELLVAILSNGPMAHASHWNKAKGARLQAIKPIHSAFIVHLALPTPVRSNSKGQSSGNFGSFYLNSLIINVIYRTGLKGKLFSQTAKLRASVELTLLNLHFTCPNIAQRHKGREFNSRPLDVDVLWLLSFKTTESEKKLI